MKFRMGAFTTKLKKVIHLDTGGGAKSFDPDDKWSNLYREREKNHLYKWVGFSEGGDLLEAYDEDGEEGITRFTHEKIVPVLANDGEKQDTIRYSEYMKWIKTQSSNLGGGEELIQVDGEQNFQEHHALWKLNKRGVEGETAVHRLLDRGDPKCTEIAKILIKEFPLLAGDIYEGPEKFGQSAIHLAVVHDDYDMVCRLLEAGAKVSIRATGTFFHPEDQKGRSTKKQTNYVGYAYYGEYPLAFAACFANKDIYDALIQYGADPNCQDSYGNTVLHICVINNSISMYSYAVRHWAKPADVNILNSAGYTPLTLAGQLGRKEIFEEMLELMKVEFWRFSDMACSAYPLTALDTIKPDGSTNWDSALMTIINGNTKEHLDMIVSEVTQRLLADKWKAFAFRKFMERLGLLLLHLVMMCFAVYMRPDHARDLFGGTGWQNYVRYVAEIIVILNCIFFVIQQQGAEIRRQGVIGYTKNLRNAPAKGIFLVANVCILLCVPCRFLSLYLIEEALLVFALPGSWFFLLFFARGALLTGPFVQMIYSMIAGDIARFAIISLIFLVSFSQVFYFVGKDMPKKQEMSTCPVNDHEIFTFTDFGETFITLFRASMGGYDYEEFQCAHYEFLTKLIFMLYMVIMPVMLINMLIAMMGNTYSTVISQAEKAWRQQWAQIVMVLERSINKEKLARYQLDYSIKLSDAGADGMEVRGLMVIKQTKNTKARQRKHAVSNWKTVGRKVIRAIGNHGKDRAQALLHSHSRVPTPVLAHSDSNSNNKLMDLALGASLGATLGLSQSGQHPHPTAVREKLSRISAGSTPRPPNDGDMEEILKEVELSAPSSDTNDPFPPQTETATKRRTGAAVPESLEEFGRRSTAQALPNIPDAAVSRVKHDTFRSKSQSPSKETTRSHTSKE